MKYVTFIVCATILGGSLIVSAWMIGYAIDRPTDLEQARDYCRDAPDEQARDTCIFRVLTDNAGN